VGVNKKLQVQEVEAAETWQIRSRSHEGSGDSVELVLGQLTELSNLSIL
jgi:hypothetical protein